MPSLRERLWAALTPPHIQDNIRALVEHVTTLTEPGWIPLSGLGESLAELDPLERQDALEASYYYWQRDPLYSRAVRLTRNYTFGRGVTWRAEHDEVGEVLKRFWSDPDNALMARAMGQWELSERLQLAGELFLVFFVNAYDGHVKVSLVEPGEITQIIADPDNRRRALYYERQWTRQAFNWDSRVYAGVETKTDYYPDWGCPEAQLPDQRQAAEMLATEDDPSGTGHSTVAIVDGQGKPLTYVYMHRVKINSHGQRGIPAYYNSIPWIKAYKGFMEDRATLTLAAATFAFKQKIKGAAAAVARMASQWGNYTAGRYGGRGGKERAEGAQTLIENEAVNLEQFNFDTRAGNAYQDGRMLRQQVAAGTDITEPDLTGDPSIGNLASMTAMNGPQLKGFESWQQLFKDIYTDVFDFVIRMAAVHGDLALKDDLDLTVEVDFPPIVVGDLPTLINAVASLISAQSLSSREYVSPQRLAAYILRAFGETDVEKAVAELDLDQMALSVPDFAEPEALPDEHADAVQAAIEALRVAVRKNGR